MHVRLLWFVKDLIPTPMKTSARISRKQTGESIPSIERTSTGQSRYSGDRVLLLRGWPVAAAHVER